MARPRNDAQAQAAAEQQREDRADEAEAAEDQAETAAEAEERRERERERASGLKSVPEGAGPPTEKTTRAGDTQFARDRLIAEGAALTGYEPHVLAGALHEVDKEYLTVAEANKLVEQWLQRPALMGSTTADQGEEG